MFLEDWHDMSKQTAVGELIAACLEQCGVRAAFGVISIHNMPILDAFGRRGNIRLVPARGEAGATNMADAYARVSGGLGVSVTSTGTAAGAMVEALTAGTPLLHLTGQIETPYLDRDLAYIHEAPDQLSMLQAVSKAAFRVRSADTAWPMHWRRRAGRCCGSAAVRAAQAVRSRGCSSSASASSPASRGAASSPRTIPCRSAPSTSIRASKPSTRAATRCWWSARGCAATRR